MILYRPIGQAEYVGSCRLRSNATDLCKIGGVFYRIIPEPTVFDKLCSCHFLYTYKINSRKVVLYMMRGRKAILKTEDWRYLPQRPQKEVGNAVMYKITVCRIYISGVQKTDTAPQKMHIFSEWRKEQKRIYMKNERNGRLFYGCFIKTPNGGEFLLTRLQSCSSIGARVFTPKSVMGVLYSKKSPQGEQVPFMHGIGAGFSFFKKEGT